MFSSCAESIEAKRTNDMLISWRSARPTALAGSGDSGVPEHRFANDANIKSIAIMELDKLILAVFLFCNHPI